jgi:hypothetical protein
MSQARRVFRPTQPFLRFFVPFAAIRFFFAIFAIFAFFRGYPVFDLSYPLWASGLGYDLEAPLDKIFPECIPFLLFVPR